MAKARQYRVPSGGWLVARGQHLKPEASDPRPTTKLKRPGPATRAAVLVGHRGARFSPPEAARYALARRRSLGNIRGVAHAADQRSAAIASRWWPSPADVEGLSEKAATPGYPETRRNAFPRNPPVSSPSRTAGNHQLCRTLQQGRKTSHVCSASTLLEQARARN
jgi:hypothetical protein